MAYGIGQLAGADLCWEEPMTKKGKQEARIAAAAVAVARMALPGGEGGVP